MKADCKINMKELTNIVDGMLAEKNKLGRETFKHMTEDESYGEAPDMLDGYIHDIFDIVKRSGFGEDARGQLVELLNSLIEEVNG